MTLGYAPTMGEVKEYYGREDVARAILGHAKLRQIIMVCRRGFGNRQEVSTGVPQDLVDLSQRSLFLSGTSMVPLLYPSYHGTIMKDNGVCDMVFEVDMKKSYKKTFKSGSLLLRVFDRFDLPYKIKFSGNTSPHIIIPGEAFPEYARGRRFPAVARAINAYVFGRTRVKTDGSFASGNHFLRLPYSINENTGLVSVPIPRDEFSDFDPIRAEIGRFEVDQDWWEIPDQGRRRVEEFISEVTGEARSRPGTSGLGFEEALGDEGHRDPRHITVEEPHGGIFSGLNRNLQNMGLDMAKDIASFQRDLANNLSSLQREIWSRTEEEEEEGDRSAADGGGGNR